MKKIIFLLPVIVFLAAGCNLSDQIISTKSPTVATTSVDVATVSSRITTSSDETVKINTTNNETKATNTISTDINTLESVSICNLVNNPSDFVDKQVKTTATLKARGANFLKEEYYLEDANCQISVSAWVPISVGTCPPTVKDCKRPKTMGDYVNKPLILSGTLQQPLRRLVNKQWVVSYWFTTDMDMVSIVK